MQLSQQMLQNLELLQMPILALKEKVEQELEENPTLEVEAEEPEAPPPVTDAAAEREESRRQEFLQAVEEEFQDATRSWRKRGSSEESDRKMEFLQNIGDKPASLQEHLRNQVGLMEVDPTLRSYLERLIDYIDDDGYLKEDLAAVARMLPEELRKLPPESVMKRLEAALATIQKLDPRGVGARTRQECLQLQLDEHDPAFTAKRRLIERHLDDIGNNRLPKIVRDVAA